MMLHKPVRSFPLWTPVAKKQWAILPASNSEKNTVHHYLFHVDWFYLALKKDVQNDIFLLASKLHMPLTQFKILNEAPSRKRLTRLDIFSQFCHMRTADIKCAFQHFLSVNMPISCCSLWTMLILYYKSSTSTSQY